MPVFTPLHAQSATYKVEVDKVHLELEEWQRLIEHQRTAISLQEV
eukprot:COSAG02_NODE_44431_length_366_cov_0.842697_1_plen_44_part_01